MAMAGASAACRATTSRASTRMRRVGELGIQPLRSSARVTQSRRSDLRRVGWRSGPRSRRTAAWGVVVPRAARRRCSAPCSSNRARVVLLRYAILKTRREALLHSRECARCSRVDVLAPGGISMFRSMFDGLAAMIGWRVGRPSSTARSARSVVAHASARALRETRTSATSRRRLASPRAVRRHRRSSSS